MWQHFFLCGNTSSYVATLLPIILVIRLFTLRTVVKCDLAPEGSAERASGRCAGERPAPPTIGVSRRSAGGQWRVSRGLAGGQWRVRRGSAG
eukprot:4952239-Pyramimonas_sp.AAC.2